MNGSSLQRLDYLCNNIPPLLHHLPEEEFSFQPAPEKWSKKQILGHLIDSAANNHQRFIRVQYEEMPTLFYDQNKWNALSHYNQKSTAELIEFWTLYNKHLVHIIQNMAAENLERKCKTGEREPVTLRWLIDDYVKHLEHHLHQLVDYS
ncbi:MAG TPA: DinB family protein [Flavisolibacter sp.]|nr:DinB family protein [Flavisolibacter sp.]